MFSASETMDPSLSNSTQIMWQKTPYHVTQCQWIYWVRETDYVWSERKGLLLDCSVSAKENRKEDDQSRPRQARLDRRPVHNEESSVTFSRSIGMELDSVRSIVSITEFWRCYITHRWHTYIHIFLYQLAQACPHNVPHFLILQYYGVFDRSLSAFLWPDPSCVHTRGSDVLGGIFVT